MNNIERKQFLMQDLENKLKWLEENTSHNVIYLALQGSQNYEMDVYTAEYQSDVDVKAIIVPSFDDILKGKDFFSHTYIMDDNSHIDVKDIRLYINMWKKANPAYLEILFTEFYILKNVKFKQILDMADSIAEANISRLLSCIKGMQMEKYKALKHPYPTLKDKIDKYGYDPKQYHHIYRLFIFTRDLCELKYKFKDALVINNIADKQKCLDAKTKTYALDTVEAAVVKYIELTENIIYNYRASNELTVHEDTYKEMENIIYSIIKANCICNLL